MNQSHATLVIQMSMVIFFLTGCGPGGAPALSIPGAPWNTNPPIPMPKPLPPGTIIHSPRDQKHDEFQIAIRLMMKSQVDEMIQMLEEDPQLITWEHQDNGGLLNEAAHHGQVPIVKYLLEHGANPNTRNSFGATPLYICIINTGKNGSDYVRIVDLLLAHGADINARFYPLTTLKVLHGIELTHTDTMLDFGEKMQRSQWYHIISRNEVMARFREHLGLPVDAMLPLNATTLYQQLPKSQ